jgi:hypothetical protein
MASETPDNVVGIVDHNPEKAYWVEMRGPFYSETYSIVSSTDQIRIRAVRLNHTNVAMFDNYWNCWAFLLKCKAGAE